MITDVLRKAVDLFALIRQWFFLFLGYVAVFRNDLALISISGKPLMFSTR